MFCSPEIRRPKTEGRNPKEGRNPNSEFREWPDSIGGCSAGVAINSDLGLRVSFGLRVSGWEWPGPTSEQPWGRGEGELSSLIPSGNIRVKAVTRQLNQTPLNHRAAKSIARRSRNQMADRQNQGWLTTIGVPHEFSIVAVQVWGRPEVQCR